MFEYLKDISPRLHERYLTLEGNVKSGSNSFYDAYLDLLEEFIKHILIKHEIEFSHSATCGALLRNPKVLELFSSVYGINEYYYGKLQDYTGKVNSHKHRGEKKITLDTVIKYYEVFRELLCCYGRMDGATVPPVDSEYISEIFGIYERENCALRAEVKKLKAELSASAVEGKLSKENLEALQRINTTVVNEKAALEEQNLILHRQISALKDIKLSSMEEKLNRTIELLLELKPAITENRIITRAVGRRMGQLIDGNVDLESWIADEEERYKKSDE